MAKKKQIKIINWLDFGIFPGTVLFTCGYSHKELMANLKKTKAKEWRFCIEGDEKTMQSSCVMHRELMKPNEPIVNYFYLCLKDFDFSDHSYCVLAHECLHLVQFHLKQFLDPDREFECAAYLHTHLMTQALKHLRGK